MQGLRCPKCKAVSYPGLMGFPRCHRCHEQLRQCRYCRHQTGGLCQLDRVGAPPLLESDGRPYCESYEPAERLTGGADPWRVPRPAQPWMLGSAALCVAALALALAVLVSREPTGARIEAHQASAAVVDGRAVATFTVVSDRRRFDTVTVRIGGDALRHFELAESTPPPLRYVGATGGWAYALPPDGRFLLRLTLTARPDAPPYEDLEVAVLGPDGVVESTARVGIDNREQWRSTRPNGR